jgi:hypothetical protein
MRVTAGGRRAGLRLLPIVQRAGRTNGQGGSIVTLTLLTRAYCHLCDEMRAALQPLAHAAGARITEIDIDAEPALEARYGDLVPVLLLGSVDGVELCHYRLDATRVRDALGGTP